MSTNLRNLKIFQDMKLVHLFYKKRSFTISFIGETLYPKKKIKLKIMSLIPLELKE